MHVRSLLILGCGYVGERLARACLERGMRVMATTRRPERAAELVAHGIEAQAVASPEMLQDDTLAACEAILDSIPLARDAADVRAVQPQLLQTLAPRLARVRWAGYLSTTGVYGDAGGAWVDETWECRPTSPRGSERLKAEQAWLGSGLPAEVFRIAGIYGPGRNLIARLRAGGYRAVRWQPPHFSSRIHVDDIVAAILAAMANPSPGRIVNLADDLPLPHDEYVLELARAIGAPQPEILDAAQAEAEMPAATLDFFRDNKRVSNRRLHRELLPQLNYPDFRSAITDLLQAEAASERG